MSQGATRAVDPQLQLEPVAGRARLLLFLLLVPLPALLGVVLPWLLGEGGTFSSQLESAGTVLATLDEVPAGGGLVLADRSIVLVRGDGDEVHAFSAVCTHQGCAVSTVADGAIDCPCHGTRFDARTGAVLTGPATRPLPAVAVTVSGSDVVTA